MTEKSVGADLILPRDYSLITFDRVDSTNAEARRRVANGEGMNSWILAAEQTHGRGRRGRTWVSEPGNLYASLILCPHVPLNEAAQLSFVSALALHSALSSLLPATADIRCKWPNDILLGGKKVAGILLESASSAGQETNWVIVGIGVNVAHFPAEVEFPASSLKAAGYGIEIGPLFQALAASMAEWLETWRVQGFAAIREAWKARAAGLGQQILVRLETQTLSGQFQDLSERGELMLALDRGEVKPVSAGDVFFSPDVKPIK